MKEIFQHSVAVGEGFVCNATPFSGVFVIDYYDGAIEGFARLSGTKSVMYFKKIWWDERQSNRLFAGIIVSDTNLKTRDSSLVDYLDEHLNSRDWVEPLPRTEQHLVEKLKEFFTQADVAVRINILCREITGELFILPTLEE